MISGETEGLPTLDSAVVCLKHCSLFSAGTRKMEIETALIKFANASKRGETASA